MRQGCAAGQAAAVGLASRLDRHRQPETRGGLIPQNDGEIRLATDHRW